MATIAAAPPRVARPRLLGLPLRLNPVNQRRLANFKANRRGYVSLHVFLLLFGLSLFAECIANDKPFLIYYDGGIYLPFLTAYPETTFGGDFPTEADYTDPFVSELIAERGWMLWPPIRYSYDTVVLDLPGPAPSPPTRHNLLGTDDQARDVLARVIYGFRISVLFGLALTLLSSVVGVLAGAVQGYFGGWVDLLFQRFIEIWTSMPTLFLLIILASVVTPNFWWLLGLLLLFSWTALVGVVRAEFLRARNFDFVRAARALGRRAFHHHAAAHPAQRHGRDAHLHAVHPDRRHHQPDRPGFPRLRPAAGLAVARRAACPGQEQPAGALAGHHAASWSWR